MKFAAIPMAEKSWKIEIVWHASAVGDGLAKNLRTFSELDRRLT